MNRLIEKNIIRRFGSHCAECGVKLNSYRLDGIVDNKSVGFCSFQCCDNYTDTHSTEYCKTINEELRDYKRNKYSHILRVTDPENLPAEIWNTISEYFTHI